MIRRPPRSTLFPYTTPSRTLALELGEQPCLPDAGLAGQERHRRLLVAGVSERSFQRSELGGPSDQSRAADARAHRSGLSRTAAAAPPPPRGQTRPQKTR